MITTDLVPSHKELTLLASDFLKSGMFPNVKTLAGAITIVEYGRELGIPPVAALQTMCVISGKLAMEAKAMLALANRNAGVTWEVKQWDGTGCAMIFSRPGFKDLEVSWTEQDAKDANLLGKQNWKTYKKDMFFARCSSRGVRAIASDAVLGLYSKEEAQDGFELNPDLAVEKIPHSEEPKEKEKAKAQPEEEIKEAEIVEEDTPVPPEKEPPPKELSPSEAKDDIINLIHHNLELLAIQDEKSFKEWLYGNQPEWGKHYVDFHGKTLRFHKGDYLDLVALNTNMTTFVTKYNDDMKNHTSEPEPEEQGGLPWEK